MADLVGCIEKLNRARVNLDTLKGEIEGFLKGNPYVVRLKVHRDRLKTWNVDEASLKETLEGLRPDDPTTQFAVYERLPDGKVKIGMASVEEFGIHLERRADLPVARWGVLVGDIVHDLRSSLDHLVWQLTLANGNVPPPEPFPQGSPWKRIGCPIFIDKQTFSKRDKTGQPARGSGLDMIWGIRPGLVTAFENLQPCERSRKYPERDPLWMLHELWNRDKHRTVHIVSSLGRFEAFGPGPPDWPDDLPVQLSVLKRRRLGPLKDDAELARVLLLNPDTNLEGLYKAVDMNLQFTIDVAFEKGYPTFGRKVFPALEDLLNRCTGFIAKFKPEFP